MKHINIQNRRKDLISPSILAVSYSLQHYVSCPLNLTNFLLGSVVASSKRLCFYQCQLCYCTIVCFRLIIVMNVVGYSVIPIRVNSSSAVCNLQSNILLIRPWIFVATIKSYEQTSPVLAVVWTPIVRATRRKSKVITELKFCLKLF